MAGQKVPLVLFARHTTLVGLASANQSFTTMGIDVSPYDAATVMVWRGKLVGGTTPAFKIWFESSTDQTAWGLCSGSPSPGDPGENARIVYTLELTKRWLRARVQLGGADNVVSFWATGTLEERVP